MQVFSCPFCGPRDETEFHFVSEEGKSRPNTSDHVPAEEWAHYLYTQRNELGHVREIWMHKTCAELFVLERDSLTMKVVGSRPCERA